MEGKATLAKDLSETAVLNCLLLNQQTIPETQPSSRLLIHPNTSILTFSILSFHLSFSVPVAAI